MDASQARALGERLLHPARPRLAEALHLAANGEHVREVWERLAARETIPAAWLATDGGARTGHACCQCDSAGEWVRVDGSASDPADAGSCRTCDGRGFVEYPHPPNVGAALTLAADVEGVVTAEALARECAARFAAWGHTTGTPRVVWRTDTPHDRAGRPCVLASWPRFQSADPAGTQAGDVRLAQAARADLALLSETARVAREAFDTGARGDGPALAPVDYPPTDRDCAVEAAGWDVFHAVMSAGLRAARIAPFHERADPYEPLLGIWALGYGVEVLAREFIVLFAPPPSHEAPVSRSSS